MGPQMDPDVPELLGGSVTWSFAAQYHLSGAVAPTNGNRVNLLLEYDPVSNTVVELGRAATTI